MSSRRASEAAAAAAPFRVGLLGHGTVGGGLRGAAGRARRRDRALQRPPARDQRGAHAHAGRLRGDPRRRPTLLVEVMGGIEPAREYLLRRDARRQGRRHRQQAAALPARRGAVRDRPRARRAAALRGGRRRRRAGRAGARGVARRPRRSSASTGSSTARPTSSSPRWRTAAPTRRRSPRRSAGASPRPTRATTSAAATRPPRWRSSRGSRSARRCTSTTCSTRASSTCTLDDLEYARELGLGLKLIGTAERRGGGLSVRVYPTFLYAGHPLASIVGAVQRGHGRVGHDHRDHHVGARRGRAADRERGARRRRQRDDRRRAAARAAAAADAVRGRRERLLPAPRRRRPPRRARRR